MADFADSYAAGRTPVPCVRCNQTVKFTDLMALASDLGADAMATGHYVRRVDGADGPELHRAADLARDQSWFLFATTGAQLARTLFPLGAMPDKAAVRAEAVRMGLDVAAKPDSQDICFVPAGRYDAVVAAMRPDAAEAGEIVDQGGRCARHPRRHRPLHRRAGAWSRPVGAERQVVVRLDAATRRIVVGPRTTGTRRISLREVNWLVPPHTLRAEVKLRARDTLRPASVEPAADGGATVWLDEAALPPPARPACSTRAIGCWVAALSPERVRGDIDGGGRAGYLRASRERDGGVAQR